MASGFGVKGNVGRCFPLYKDYSACMSTASDPGACAMKREDYFECLHNQKAAMLRTAIGSAAEKQGIPPLRKDEWGHPIAPVKIDA